ncbi:MAG TPA: hypothetical protein VF126_15900 [Acidobacteriaceae bacterium]
MIESSKPDPRLRASHLAIGVSVLLLALAVFGWGLHSKLELYHLRARAAEGTPTAKLLSERERPTDTAQHVDLNRAELHLAALIASVILMPQEREALRVRHPRTDAPPRLSLSIARSGPALRRPPPLLAA